jgi:hypothetical protein
MAYTDYEKAWKKIMKEKGISQEDAIKELDELLTIPYPWEEAKKKKNKKAIKAKRKVA